MIYVRSDSDEFVFYKAGVWTGCTDRDPIFGLHVILVGYGTVRHMANSEFVRIKNTWGKDWGMDGFMEIATGDEGGHVWCGVFHKNLYPTEVELFLD